MTALVDAFGYGLEDLRWFTINAMKSAFLPFDERLAIIDDVIKPGYADARVAASSSAWSADWRRQTGAMSFLYDRPSRR